MKIDKANLFKIFTLAVAVVLTLSMLCACSHESDAPTTLENTANNEASMSHSNDSIINESSQSTIKQTDEAKEKTTETEIDTSKTSAMTVKINTAIREQMGKSAYSPTENENIEILKLLENLELYPIEQPDIRDFPTGGSIIVYRYADNGSYDTFNLYSKEIIEYNGNYYSSDSKSYDELVSILSDILYNY